MIPLSLQHRLKSAAISFLILTSLPLLSQQSKIDSIKARYLQQELSPEKLETLVYLWEASAYVDADSAFAYARRGIALSQRINERGYEAKFIHRLGVNYHNLTQHDSALFYYAKAKILYSEVGEENLSQIVNGNLAIIHYEKGDFEAAHQVNQENMDWFRESGNTQSLAWAESFAGLLYNFQGQLELAGKHLYKALALFEKTNSGEQWIADVRQNLAHVAFAQQNIPEAINQYQATLAIYQRLEDQLFISQAMNDLGNIYLSIGKLDSAEYYLKNSFSLSKEVEAPLVNATTLGNLGKLEAKKGNYKQAIDSYGQALKALYYLGSPNKILEIHIYSANAYLDMGQASKGLFHIDSTIFLAGKVENIKELAEGYRIKAQLLKQDGQFKAALDTYEEHLSWKDSFINEQSNKSLAEMQTLYELGKKEEQISFLEERVQWNKQRNRGLIIGIILSILAGLSFTLWLITRNRKNQKIRQQEKEIEQERLKAMELEQGRLEDQLQYRQRELSAKALHLCQKNELLSNIKSELDETPVNSTGGSQLAAISRKIDQNLKDNQEWNTFMESFTEVHPDFLPKLKDQYPDLSPNECRLAALYKLNLSSKDIAQLLHISPDSVKKARNRLRKKMDLVTSQNLADFFLAYPNQ